MALLGEDELCFCDLIAILDLARSTISRHLAYLRNGGLVTGERRGKWMYYQLTTGKDRLTYNLLERKQSQAPRLHAVTHARIEGL